MILTQKNVVDLYQSEYSVAMLSNEFKVALTTLYKTVGTHSKDEKSDIPNDETKQLKREVPTQGKRRNPKRGPHHLHKKVINK